MWTNLEIYVLMPIVYNINVILSKFVQFPNNNLQERRYMVRLRNNSLFKGYIVITLNKYQRLYIDLSRLFISLRKPIYFLKFQWYIIFIFFLNIRLHYFLFNLYRFWFNFGPKAHGIQVQRCLLVTLLSDVTIPVILPASDYPFGI